MTEKLKPCPFCGGEARISKMGYPHWIYCENCGAKVHGRVVGEQEGERASIEAWNRRAEQAGWIKTSERLPEVGEPVLVHIPATGWHGASMKVLRLNDSHLWVGSTACYYPEKTLWMPLPEEPKEVEENEI